MNRMFPIAALALMSLQAGSQEAPTDESVRSVRYYVTYEVNADGTAVETVERVLSPMKRTAIDGIAQQTIEYQEDMQTIDIIEAYTMKKDGRRIDVAADKIIVQVPPQLANAPMYTDSKVKRIIFSDVEVSDQLVLRYKLQILVPKFPGHFQAQGAFPKNFRYDDVVITVKHPKTYPLQFQARGMDSKPDREENGVVVHEWRYKNDSIVTPDPVAISHLDRDPLYEISSFKNWADIAVAFNARAKDKAVPTAEVKQLADEITKDINSKPEQAKAIYAWVTKNIRYVAVYLGAGGFVPHSANSILENRYGDCKDYSTLMSALLNAKNIANEIVIIDASNRYALPTIATPGAFNHAILYLNDIKVYLDATARSLPFGALAPTEANKQVLHTNLKKIMATPNIKLSDRLLKSDSELVVDASGALKGTTTLTDSDLVAAEIQGLLGRLENPQAAKQVTNALLSIDGFAGTADFTDIRPQFATTHVAYKSAFAINGFANLPGPGAIRVPTGIMSINSLRLVAMQTLNTPPATMDRNCLPGVFEESSTIKLPENLKPGAMPKDVNASNKIANYKASYVVEGDIIKVQRRYELTASSTVCSPQDWQLLREILEQIRHDTAAQLTY